nr:hypothetical protein [Tanacetum cinerariifolium]
MGEAAPKPKASARKKKGEFASSTTPLTLTPTTTVESAPRLSATAKGKQHARAITPTEPTDVQRTKAEQLKIALKRSRQETHISQQPSDDEDVGGHEKGDKSDESDDERNEGSDDDSDETVKAGAGKDDDDNDEEEELAKSDEEDTETGKGGDEVSESAGESEEEETRQEGEESFDPIPRTHEESEEESNDEEDQELRLSEAPIPPLTIPSIILENLPTFNLAFRFEERLRSLETSFSEY